MKQFEIKLTGSGSAMDIVVALENLTEGLRANLEDVGTSKGSMTTGIFEDETLCTEIKEI